MDPVADLKNFYLETERLLLVPISHDYDEDIFREFTPEVTVHLFPQPSESLSDTSKFIGGSVENMLKGDELQLVALDKETKEFLGCIGLHKLKEGTPELGLWFKKSVWGKGYGKESMLSLKNWAQENLIHEELSYPVAKENFPSRKIAEFLGGEVIREYIGKNAKGKEMEDVEYRIKFK